MAYATYSDYTLTHSDKGISESEITNGWLPWGTQRVNECLGGFYTLPFSTNNATARSLCIDYTHLGILIRTRQIDDSEELRLELDKRCASLTSSGSPMMTDSNDVIYPEIGNSSNAYSVYSSTENYKPVFDLRDSVSQRVDPDQLQDLWDEDLL